MLRDCGVWRKEQVAAPGRLAYARAGDTLAVVQLDRLGRSLVELLETVKMLRERKDRPSQPRREDRHLLCRGELIFHVFGAIAHFERRLISERTKGGIAAARARGKRPGRQPLDLKKVEIAIKLVEANVSPAEAARQLGLGRSTVYREMSGWVSVGPLRRTAFRQRRTDFGCR